MADCNAIGDSAVMEFIPALLCFLVLLFILNTLILNELSMKLGKIITLLEKDCKDDC